MIAIRAHLCSRAYLYRVFNTAGKKYFLQQFLGQEYLHGGVGPADAEQIMLTAGYEPILFPHQDDFTIKAKINRYRFLHKALSDVPKGSTVVFLFPFYARMHRLFISRLRRRGDVTIICFIADIDGLKDDDSKLLRREVRFLKGFNRFIVHNERMKEWVHATVSPSAMTASIDFFDFPALPFAGRRQLSPDVVFAGNLEKSPFIYELHKLKGSGGVRFHLFGPGQTKPATQSNVRFYGVEKPHALPAKLPGSFGLVWDGESIEKPAGSLGDYMQYISHHKLSLYILAGLPLIVPSTGAAALLVRKYGIGIIVDSLYELEERLGMVTVGEYEDMRRAMNPLAVRISGGKNLLDALATLH